MVRADRQPRQRLSPETRRASILTAASAAYAESSFDRVSLDDIARDAAASKALILKYFGSKANLYAAVVEEAVSALNERQALAISRLPEGGPAMDSVRASISAYLDHIEEHPRGWSEPLLATHPEPEPAARVRVAARRAYVSRLAQLFDLDPTDPASEFALWGFYALLDEACLRWVSRGCSSDDRQPLTAVVIAALTGLLSTLGTTHLAQ